MHREYTLLIDVGNTFLKWGMFLPSAGGAARENRVESGHALLEEITALPVQFAKLPTPAKIVMGARSSIAACSHAIALSASLITA